ncbi:MAG: TRAP transporter small permease [Paracoccus sp. (in: a-proteobacteria)]|uniref:TRAP transporter small permease n=1 Tax=Paracoccus sp. TaxID=267 RepID=UPI002E833121|nr:TRAP transporter small permease [Pseudomonadota bacterium]
MQPDTTPRSADPDDPRLAEPVAAPDDIDDSLYRSDLPGPLGALDQAIARVEAVMLAFGVLAMATNTVANVVGRFGFGQSLYFSEEVNQALIVLITFAGLSYAARHGRHIRMSAILDALPYGVRKAGMVIISALTAALLLLLAWYAFTYVQTQASRGRVLPALRIPQWWIIVWAPAGFFLTGLQYALTALKNLTHDGIWLSTVTQDGYDAAPEEERRP